MQQVVDMETSPEFQQLGVTLVSIASDSQQELRLAATEYRTKTALLSDPGRRVIQQYGVSRWAMGNGEPGHTFVLVGKDGTVKWVRDYGSPENGGLMYVPLEQLLAEIKKRL
jgi:peroxiredoxin Q/BCP